MASGKKHVKVPDFHRGRAERKGRVRIKDGVPSHEKSTGDSPPGGNRGSGETCAGEKGAGEGDIRVERDTLSQEAQSLCLGSGGDKVSHPEKFQAKSEGGPQKKKSRPASKASGEGEGKV